MPRAGISRIRAAHGPDLRLSAESAALCDGQREQRNQELSTMRVLTPYRRVLAVVAVTAAGLLALTGCQLGEDRTAGAPQPTPSSSASAQPNPSGKGTPRPSSSGKAGEKKSGGLPDVCTLLSRAEVTSLTGGRQVVQVDEDGAKAGASTRHCQWQLSGARLAIFLSPTTASEFAQAHRNSPAVGDLGDEAHLSSGHLYVRHGDIQVDVYATLDSDEAAGEKLAKAAARKVIDRL
jgi:Protein of unknown function (DUF3558)